MLMCACVLSVLTGGYDGSPCLCAGECWAPCCHQPHCGVPPLLDEPATGGTSRPEGVLPGAQCLSRCWGKGRSAPPRGAPSITQVRCVGASGDLQAHPRPPQLRGRPSEALLSYLSISLSPVLLTQRLHFAGNSSATFLIFCLLPWLRK